MHIQWLTTAGAVAACAACLYMWSYAELLPERWHRLFRIGSWGAMIGAPAGAGTHLAISARMGAHWWDLSVLADPSQRLSVYLGALLGSLVACHIARLRRDEALRMAAACASPVIVGLCLAAVLAGRAYSFFMLDAWHAPASYLAHVQHHLALGYLAIALAGGGLFSLAFSGRVWRMWGAALPEDLGLAGWEPLELDLELEPEGDEREARA